MVQPCQGAPGGLPCPSERSQVVQQGQAARGVPACLCLVCLGSQEGQEGLAARASQGAQALLSGPLAAAAKAFLRETEKSRQSESWTEGTKDMSSSSPQSSLSDLKGVFFRLGHSAPMACGLHGIFTQGLWLPHPHNHPMSLV